MATVLTLLRENAQRSIRNIAFLLEKPLPFVEAEAKQLEDVVERCCSLVNFEALGFPHRAVIFTQHPIESTYVNKQQKTSSGYITELVFENLQQLETVKGTLSEYRLHFVLDALKEEAMIVE